LEIGKVFCAGCVVLHGWKKGLVGLEDVQARGRSEKNIDLPPVVLGLVRQRVKEYWNVDRNAWILVVPLIIGGTSELGRRPASNPVERTQVPAWLSALSQTIISSSLTPLGVLRPMSAKVHEIDTSGVKERTSASGGNGRKRCRWRRSRR
jgi:hypothetical protein